MDEQQTVVAARGPRAVGKATWSRPAPTSQNGQWTAWTSERDGWSVLSGPTGVVVSSPQALSARAAGELADAIGAAAAYDEKRSA